MLDDLRLAPLLHGHRGRPGVDLGAVARAIEAIAALAATLGPDLDALEVNPLVAHPDGVTAVDALLLLRTGGS
jgi:acetyltransferase